MRMGWQEIMASSTVTRELADQGMQLAFEKADAVSTMEKVAAGTLSEPELASWFRDRLRQGT
jgi:prophage maintenance system killer protein